jgi:hypothetical protein
MVFVRQSVLALLLLALGIAASACGPQPPAQAPDDLSEDAAETEAETGSSATPQASVITEIPEPGAETGVVHGLLLNAATQEPITSENAAADIYLAQIIHTSADRPYSLFDQQTSPHTNPDSRGVFVFSDVEPGEYAISVVTPMSQVIARSADNIEEDLVFQVEAGTTVDLGEIYARYP